MRDYVAMTYNVKDKPFTKYPQQLAEYIVKRYEFHGRLKILDVGCGRGEYLKGFVKCGLKGYGIDQFIDIAKEICPWAEIRKDDFERFLPYQTNYFDIVFVKSVFEHLYYPEKLAEELYRTLKPNGIIIALTPDWRHCYKTFFGDFTHRTPFTLNSLKELLILSGFDNVETERFLQAPILWKYPWLKPFLQFVAYTMPFITSKSIKFSKAVMLLASGKKMQSRSRP